jgi:hypothetical protein
MDSTNNGILSMLMNGRETPNQKKENSTRSLDFTLKEISILFLNYQTTDISQLMTEKT